VSTRSIGTAHEQARRVSLGMACCECDEPFVAAHGFPVACGHCWPKLSLEERKVVARATNAEATAQHFRTAAKKRKAQNQESE
jgi:hypothetical protein